MIHKDKHGYIDHVIHILEKSTLHQNDLTYAYVIRNVHQIVNVSTLISETLARLWSVSTNFRRSVRSVQKINFDTILISIDQRIYWWKISTVLINIDWLINLYTSQYSVFALRSTFIKSVSWHGSHKGIDQVEDFFPCLAALSAKSRRLACSACLRQSVKLRIAVENFSLYILQPAYKFLTFRLFVSMFTCLPACVISVKTSSLFL